MARAPRRLGTVLVLGVFLAACGRVGFMSQSELDGSVGPDARAPFDAARDAYAPDAYVPIDGGPPPPPLIEVPLRMIVLSDDDGGRTPAITAAEMRAWIDRANEIYARAGVRFTWDGTVETRRSTLLNSITTLTDPMWPTQLGQGDAIANEQPGVVPVLFRFGPGASQDPSSFAGTAFEFVVSTAFGAAIRCGGGDLERLARDLGFHLGLTTTHSAIYASLAEAESAYDGDASIFEWDELPDTAPDPFVDLPLYECDHDTLSLELDGDVFVLPRENLMSRYDAGDKSLSETQIHRVRQGALVRTEQDIRRILDASFAPVVEGEDLVASATTSGNGFSVQGAMRETFIGRWTNNEQLFWAGGDTGVWIELTVTAPSAGRYRVVGMFCVAPDYGWFQASVNGSAMGEELHLYARTVSLSAPLEVGTFDLDEGDNTMRFTLMGLDPGAYRGALGIDYLLLEPLP
jgi:hypothetical protein